jgi:hypothetical protein
LSAAGVPEQVADRLTGGGSALNDVGGVGDLDVSILAQVPEQLRPQVEPIVPNIVDAIHAAFSIATGSTFAVGIFAALVAAALVLIVMPARRMGEGKPSMVRFRSRLTGSSSGRRSREHTGTRLDFAVTASSRLRSSLRQNWRNHHGHCQCPLPGR